MNKYPVLINKMLVICVIIFFFGISINPTIGALEEKPSIVISSKGYIQNLIDNASNGDIINIPNGTYYENIIIDKSINLIGEDKNTTIIDGNKKGSGVYITADGVTISGFTIMNSKDEYYPLYAGIEIYANYTVISGNIIKNNFIGIAVQLNSISNQDIIFIGNVISNNIIKSNNLSGIDLSRCEFTIITRNLITNNNFSAIHTNFASNNLISGNIISNNYNGISLYQYSNYNKILGNHITNNQRYCIFIYDSGKNEVIENNFIQSGKRNVKIHYYIWNIHRNKWSENYWDKPNTKPILILGKISVWLIFGIFPWFEFDWHPASKPYDI